MQYAPSCSFGICEYQAERSHQVAIAMSPSRTKSASGYSHVNKKDSAAEGTEAEKWLRKGHAACLSTKIKMKSLEAQAY